MAMTMASKQMIVDDTKADDHGENGDDGADSEDSKTDDKDLISI